MSVKTFVNLVRVAPILYQNNRVAGGESKVAGQAPFTFEGPVNGGLASDFKTDHPPQFGMWQQRGRFLPRQVNNRARTHLESISFTDGDAERFVAAPAAPVKHSCKMLERCIKETYHRPLGSDHAGAGPNHARAQDAGQIIDCGSRMRRTGEVRKHTAGRRPPAWSRRVANSSHLPMPY